MVAQTLPSYSMSCFLLPKTFCEDLQQDCAKFWWGSSLDNRKIHRKNWDALCAPKVVGGLGFHNLYAYNLAILAKQPWRIISTPSSLIAQLYKTLYFHSGNFWTAELGYKGFY